MPHNDFKIVKRNGQTELFKFEKIQKVVQWAVKGIENVDVKELLTGAKITFFDGITTKEIHQAVIEAAVNLISIEKPNYQYVAARLLNYALRKDVWGGKHPPRLSDLIRDNLTRGFYDKLLIEKYSTKEINKINEFIDHDRDYTFTHSGLRQLIDKYLVQNRENKEVYETPQFVYVLVAMTLFADEKKNRLEWVRKAYDYFSSFKINLATPVIAGCRTPLRSYASCALFSVGDSLDSIGTHDYLFKKASAARYGLGFNISAMRPVNAKIRNGDVLHTGLVPYLKNFEAGILSCHQNGLRGSSGTVYINFWHYEAEEILGLKNNALPDDKAVRFLDYAVCLSGLFLDRVKNNEEITLFNPHEVPELLEKFGTREWNDLYIKRESDSSIKMKKKISARKLMGVIAKQRLETGRIYVMFVDNTNQHGTFKETVQQSNLCCEVTHPTKASEKWNDENGLIGVCILSALNPYHIKDEEYESVCEVAVRMLDNLIEYQSYFDLAAKNFAMKYRSLGIGIINFAGWMAKNKTRYISDNAPNLAASLAEKVSYYTIKASIGLAKDRGKCEFFDKTKWADATLPIDNYQKSLDEFVTQPLKLDWEALRSDLKKNGIRNSTLLAFMPTESTSLISGATSGLEPIRDYIVSKTSRAGKVIFVAPDIAQNKEYYTLAFDMIDNEALLKIYAAIGKFTCMAISANTYLNVSHYENKQIPLSVVIKTIFLAHSMGLKTLYYNNTEDGGHTENQEDCSSGACKI